MKKLLFLFLLTLFASPILAEEPDSFVDRLDKIDKLMRAKSLKCIFGPGAMASWESGDPKIEKGDFDTTLHFDSINFKTKKARIIGNQGAGNVSAYLSPRGLTFIEETPAGNMVFTTVFLT